jgi:hypothetical protein
MYLGPGHGSSYGEVEPGVLQSVNRGVGKVFRRLKRPKQ